MSAWVFEAPTSIPRKYFMVVPPNLFKSLQILFDRGSLTMLPHVAEMIFLQQHPSVFALHPFNADSFTP
jgi:hypothetical protein